MADPLIGRTLGGDASHPIEWFILLWLPKSILGILPSLLPRLGTGETTSRGLWRFSRSGNGLYRLRNAGPIRESKEAGV